MRAPLFLLLSLAWSVSGPAAAGDAPPAAPNEVAGTWRMVWATAERDGAKSHGIFRIPGNLGSLDSGWVDGKAEFAPEHGTSNPFLHMGLHLAVRDQLTVDRPPGIRAAFDRVAKQSEDRHDAEHRVIECLAETLWEAQRDNRLPDESVYLDRVRRL